MEDARLGLNSMERAILRISPTDLDLLIGTLEVRGIGLHEVTLRNERRFEQGHHGMTHLYYGICGSASLTTAHGMSMAIAPHTMVVVPPTVGPQRQSGPAARDRAMLAGSARLLCVRFQAAFAGVIDMFSGSLPIVERFDDHHNLLDQLQVALAEQQERQPGSAAMTALLMKQVMVLLLRRSLTSPNSWVERFAILRDQRIARAFAEMTTRPGAAHTTDTLARTACLSRSTFMSRFHELVGRAPMSVLRDLRMRQAARQLRGSSTPIGQISRAAGYANNSGFIRAFRKVYGMHPRDYRAQAQLTGSDGSHPAHSTDPPTESRPC